MSLAGQLLDTIDGRIRQLVGQDRAEDQLVGLYYEFWSLLKERVGTSSGFTGLAEYLFFRFIMMSIETQTGEEFEVATNTPDTRVFRSRSLLLTHDVDVSGFLGTDRTEKPDIGVFVQEGSTSSYRLLAVFEVKIYISSRTQLEQDMKRFRNSGGPAGAFFFYVLLNRQYAEKVDEFCREFPNRAFVISREQFDHKITIGESLRKTLGHLNL